MKIINFYSYKGGVGRTMLTAQIANILFALKKKVVVVDFDFDAPGLPAVFGKKIYDIKGGILELVTNYKNVSKSNEKQYEKLKKCLSDYLVDIVENEEDDCNGKYFIKILASGCVNDNYWEKISDPEWLELLVRPEQRPSSFISFIKDILKPILVELLNPDYLLIDARAGITHYGSIGRDVANCQAMILCPNDEAFDALDAFLLPTLEKFQEKRTKEHEDNKKVGLELTNSPLDEIVFVISRIPPELNKDEREKAVEKFKQLINNQRFKYLSNAKILKLHSDLDTHLNQHIRSFGKVLSNDKEDKSDIVKIHEDILMILAALCPDEVSDAAKNNLLEEQARDLWRKISPNDFEITHKYRLYKFFERSGEMFNPDDENRNVAFKVETFLKFLNEFYKALEQKYQNDVECKKMMNESLFTSGEQCGSAFGKALIEQWRLGENIYYDKNILEQWCAFDTQAGFGFMFFMEDEETFEKFLTIKNLFILNSTVTDGQDYTAFFTGYVIGVIKKIIGKNKLNTLKMKIIDEHNNIDKIEFKTVYDEEVYKNDYLNLKSTTIGSDVIYKIELGA